MDIKEKSWQGRMGGLEQKPDTVPKKNTQLPPITLDAESSMVSDSSLILVFLHVVV